MNDRNPQPRRRRFRISLRVLLILTALIAVLFGYLGRLVHEGRRHQVASKKLAELRCLVERSYFERQPVQKTPNGTIMKSVSTLPKWIDGTFIEHSMRRITSVFITTDTPIEDAIAILSELQSVPSISVQRDARIKTSDLKQLLSQVRVESLYISNAKLDRGHLEFLSQEGLTWLCVARTQFSDPAIEDLPLSLTYFDATRTRITDEGLSSFTRLTNLKTLKLYRTPTSHAAIDQLRKQMPWCDIGWEPLK